MRTLRSDMDRNVQVDGEDGACTKRCSKADKRVRPVMTSDVLSGPSTVDTGDTCGGREGHGQWIRGSGMAGKTLGVDGRWIRGLRTVDKRVTDDEYEGHGRK